MAARRSLTATPDGIEHINRALTEKKWSREDLAKNCYCSRQPAVKFCAGKSVSKKLFVSFCEALGLDWEEIAGFKTPVPASAEPATDIDALVQTIRQQVHADIHHRCGTMRVLDMEQPIGIGDIYTSVNILEKLSGRRRLGLDELLQDYDLENFDRFLLGQIHQGRVPGLEAVERYSKLMVLGKPGAGKTTFMKRLATLCNQGEFQAHRVPVFITLKEFAEAKGKPGLKTYISQQWQACGIEDTEGLSLVLPQGQALLLLDGLDEVQEADHDRILQEIKDFTNQYRDCQIVMTCRIAAREYTFQHFTEVEVADFDARQITEFATKWFDTKNDSEKGKNFIHRLKDNQPIQELATNPLLLTLLCLVFGEAADFPANRSELYKEGLDVLLKKWDAKRNIKRDQVYKKLSLKRKEDLLSKLAFLTFEESEYFFRKKFAERHIIEYIRNLSNISKKEQDLQLDSEAILESIEAQHGLLVERAKGIYSFSHLTFHEYFAAREITSPTPQLSSRLVGLSRSIVEGRYREVFLLAVGMLPEADNLLMLMKQQIDTLLENESSLQDLLHWVCEKSKSVAVSYKQAAIRAFYFDLARDRDLVFYLNLKQNLYCTLDHTLGHAQKLDYELDLDRAIAITLDRAVHFSHSFYKSQDIAISFDNVLRVARSKIEKDISKLTLEFEDLNSQLPCNSDWESFVKWWRERGNDWVKNLRFIMIKNRNIGHNRQLTNAQHRTLQQYYDANKFLVDCLNSDCYVTKATRQYIEDTLLLPISEIEKYPVPGQD